MTKKILCVRRTSTQVGQKDKKLRIANLPRGGRAWPIWLLMVLSLSLSGCITVGPDFETPDADTADAWIDAEDERIKADPVDQREWWTSFNDPVLDDLIQRAYAQNLSLRVAGLRVHEARAALGIAVGNLYPQIQEARASASRFRVSENADIISSLPDDVARETDTSIRNYEVGFDAGWELDFWGRFRRNLEASDAELAATIADYDDVLVLLTGEVANTYILMRSFEERLEVALANVAIQERSLEIADIRFRNGLTTELDMQQARALLRDTQTLVPLFRSGARQARHALSQLVGMPPSELTDVLGEAGVIPESPAEVAVGIPADLLRRRPDIRRAEYRAAAQSARIGVAKADMYPAFGLLGSVGYVSDSTGDLVSSDSYSGLGLVGFRWKFLNYGRLRNAVRVEDARFEALVAGYEDTVLRAAREVEDGLTRFLSSRERVGFLADGVAASQRAVELSLVQYRDGVADYTRVLDAQEFLVQQQDALVASRGDVARSLVSVYKALGGGWQIREGQPFVPEATKRDMRERVNWGGLLGEDAVTPLDEAERGKWRLPDR